MAVASGGISSRTASPTSSIASGRHTVCLESMNQLARPPGLEHEGAPAHRVLEQMRPQRPSAADHGGLAHRSRTAPEPVTTSPITTDSIPSAPRASWTGPADRWVHDHDHPDPEVEDPRHLGRLDRARCGRSRRRSAGPSHARRSTRASRSAGSTRVRLAGQPPAGDVRAGVHRAGRRGERRSHRRGVDHRGLEELLAERTARTRPRLVVPGPARPARAGRGGRGCSRSTAGPASAGPSSRSPARTRDGAQLVPPLDHPHGESGHVEVVLGHRPGVLGGLAPDQRAPRPHAAGRDRRDQLGEPLGVEPADGHVVEEEERLGPGADEVVDAHRDEVDPDGVVATHCLGHQRASSPPRRCDETRTGCRYRSVSSAKQAPEAADRGARTPGRSGAGGDRPDAARSASSAAPRSTPAPGVGRPAVRAAQGISLRPRAGRPGGRSSPSGRSEAVRAAP